MGCFLTKMKLSKQDELFLLENTQFNKQQIDIWYAGFKTDCPNGELSKSKFIEVYQQLFPNGDAEKFCSHIFRAFNADSNGVIDFTEFLMAINITAKGDPEKKLKWAFKMYDVDGNGEIDKTEMLSIIQSIYDLIGLSDRMRFKIANTDDSHIESPFARTEQIFQKMDSDLNGVITQEEFITGCLQDKLLYQMLTASNQDEEETVLA